MDELSGLHRKHLGPHGPPLGVRADRHYHRPVEPGEALGVSHETVRTVRGELEATDQIGQLTETTGKDGKKRPAKREPAPPPAFEFKFDEGDEAAAKAVTKV